MAEPTRRLGVTNTHRCPVSGRSPVITGHGTCCGVRPDPDPLCYTDFVLGLLLGEGAAMACQPGTPPAGSVTGHAV